MLNASSSVNHTYPSSTSSNQYIVKLTAHNPYCNYITFDTVTTGCGLTNEHTVNWEVYDNERRKVKMISDLNSEY